MLRFCSPCPESWGCCMQEKGIGKRRATSLKPQGRSDARRESKDVLCVECYVKKCLGVCVSECRRWRDQGLGCRDEMEGIRVIRSFRRRNPGRVGIMRVGGEEGGRLSSFPWARVKALEASHSSDAWLKKTCRLCFKWCNREVPSFRLERWQYDV